MAQRGASVFGAEVEEVDRCGQYANHRQTVLNLLEKRRVTEEMVRVSVGIEAIDDIIEDFAEALEHV